jgi:hypothetical protein
VRLVHVRPVAATNLATVAWVTTTVAPTVLPVAITGLNAMRLTLVQRVVAISLGIVV